MSPSLTMADVKEPTQERKIDADIAYHEDQPTLLRKNDKTVNVLNGVLLVDTVS